MLWAGSAEAGARRLCGNTSGWRRERANRQVRLVGNEGGRDRGAPWTLVALEGGARQSCSIALDRAGTRSAVGGFREKCRGRKGIARFQRGGLGWQGGRQSNKRLLLLPMDGIASLGVLLPKLELRTGRAVVAVDGRGVVVRQYFLEFVSLRIIVSGR